MMPENKEIPNRDGYVTFYLGNKKIISKKGVTLQDCVENDAVRSPKHYKLPGLNIESIDVLRSVLTPEEFKGFCRGNALKYLIRAGKKDSELQDIKKAGVYIGWCIDTIQDQEK